MANKYRLTFDLFDTESEADRFVAERRKHRRKATKTSWSSHDGVEQKFIVWYYR